jgi:hypothetical protein
MRVRLKGGWSRTYPELTLGNVYRVLGIEADDLRIIDDAGEPILFSPRAFELVAATHPVNWISERGTEGELYAYPPQLKDPPHFFEKFFDYELSVRRKLHGYVHKLCHEEAGSIPYPPNSFMRAHAKRAKPDDPVTVYTELDEERWEVRRVDLFSGGRATYADAKGSTGNTALADTPVGSLAELSTDARFELVEIGRDEFEEAWDRAQEAELAGAC